MKNLLKGVFNKNREDIKKEEWVKYTKEVSEDLKKLDKKGIKIPIFTL